MGRPPCCDEASLKKGPWTTEEDQKLVDYISKNGHRSWNTLPKLAGLNRCGKSCRLRWTNYLRPDIKRGKFSEEEERQIIEHHSLLGNKWSAIAAHLPGRTDNEIKNYWNTHIRKKLYQMGIDPITHRQIPDLSLLANLPNLLASATNSSVTNLDCALRLQADVAQLARVQLFQTLVQVLAGGCGSTSTINAPANDFTSRMEPTGFLHNHQYYRGLLNVNSMDLLQVPYQTTKPQNSLQSLGGEEFVSLINGGSFLNTIPDVENIIQTASSIPSLVSTSPENLAVDQIKDLQHPNHIISENQSATTICESLDLDDLSGESFWKEVLNKDSSPTWPPQSQNAYYYSC